MFEMDLGVLGSDDFGISEVVQAPEPTLPELVIEKPTFLNVLGVFKSGLGLDVAKNHTGVTVWENGVATTYGFALMEYDKTDVMAEAKMRRDLRAKLLNIIQGKSFEVAIIEDVYGGDNFDTSRKLLALNTVIDDIILDGLCSVEQFFRRREPEWISDFRKIYKFGNKLNPKYETQLILEYLEFDFFLQNKDLSDAEKKDIFFEDICDSAALLCSLAMKLKANVPDKKKATVRMSDIYLNFLEDDADMYMINDPAVDKYAMYSPIFKGGRLDSFILEQVEEHPNNVLIAYLPNSKLGSFGIKHNFTFYNQGYGYLLFYNKKLRKGK